MNNILKFGFILTGTHTPSLGAPMHKALHKNKNPIFLLQRQSALDLDCLTAKQTIRKSFTGFMLLSRDICSNRACNCVTVMSNSDSKLLY